MSKKFRKTTLLILASAAVLMGIALARGGMRVGAWWVGLCFVPVLVSAWWRNTVSVICVVVFGVTLGGWRGTQYSNSLKPIASLYGQKVVLIATAQNDATYGTKSQLSFDVGGVTFLTPKHVRVPANFKVEGFGAQAVYRGDVVRVSGKLQKTLGAKQGRISYGDIQVLGRGTSWIEKLRYRFTAGMQSALPEPQASFGVGLLIGEKSTLPKTVTSNLSAAGLTHIIAVSGYNLTILVVAIRRIFSKRSKYQATLASGIVITLFVLFTGFSASIIRAVIVSMLSITAWYYGRKIRPMLLILFTAGLTAFWNPLFLWSDAGWYLSFLAFYGILVLAPQINVRFFAKKPRGILGLLVIESLCAQLMTAPYILFTFRQVALFGLVANVLVVPLVPLGMLLSLVSGLAGTFLAGISGWFALPARVLLTYMLDLAGVFARLPHAVLPGTLSLIGLLVMYGSIVVVSVALVRSNKSRGTISKNSSDSL